MSLPAARQGDVHDCPAHGLSPLVGPGAARVLVNGRFAMRQSDFASCPSAGPDVIIDGSPTVLIANLAAARMTEKCAHGGRVLAGSTNVLIGNPPVGPDGRAIQIPAECAVLRSFGGSGTGGKLDRLRDHSTSSSPVPVDVQIPGDSAPTRMLKRDVSIRGHKVSVYEPASGAPAGKWLPSGNGVEKGLATLSDEQLRNLEDSYIVPRSSSAAADYGSKPGTIRYFARNESHPQSDVDWALQHESGHAYSLNEAWAKNPGARGAWKQAIADDRRPVTPYGDTNEVEDFAEFMILYADVVGTPCETSARALFPNRFREMDKLFPRGLPVHNPSGGRGAY